MTDPDPFAPQAVRPQTAAFNAALAIQLAQMPKPPQVPVDLIRRMRAEGKGIFPPAGPLPGSDWLAIPDAPGGPGQVRLSRPDGPARGTYLHIHGGGWTLNAPEQYDRYNQRLAREAGCLVASVRYRLAPEHRWPDPAEDCLAAALWALDQGGPLVIGGESAGAHLALVTLVRLRALGRLGAVRGAVLSYGMYDLRGTPSARNWGPGYLVLSTDVIDWFAGNLAGPGADLADPALSPLLGDLAGLPPALMQAGTADPLLDDTLFLAARWRAAGGETRLAVAPGGVHAFDQFDLDIAREALARVDAFVAERLAG